MHYFFGDPALFFRKGCTIQTEYSVQLIQFMRSGEVLALKVEDYDKEAGTLHIHHTLTIVRDDDGKEHLIVGDQTKTSESTLWTLTI